MRITDRRKDGPVTFIVAVAWLWHGCGMVVSHFGEGRGSRVIATLLKPYRCAVGREQYQGSAYLAYDSCSALT